MNTLKCLGLQAEVPYQWLAAIGATVLVSGMKLTWDLSLAPCAVLHHDSDPLRALQAVWPSAQRIKSMPMCAHLLLNRKQDQPREEFQALIVTSRGHRDSWTVSSAATDLTGTIKDGTSARGPFTPGLEGAASQQTNLLKLYGCSAQEIKDALAGQGHRSSGGGIGLDPERFPNATSDGKGVFTIRPLELLAYFGLALFPVRCDGVHQEFYPDLPRQRGWTTQDHEQGVFQWPAWQHPLDAAGIDALMSMWKPGKDRFNDRLGIHASWESVRRDRFAWSSERKNATYGLTSRRLVLSDR